MNDAWKALMPGAVDGSLPEGYRRAGQIIGRDEFMNEDGGRWSESQFVGRSRTPHTTSAIEALIRRRHLQRLVDTFEIDPRRPALELGCADGLVTHALLSLGFEQLVSTDIVPATVATLDRSLTEAKRDRLLLLVDDLMRLPFGAGTFHSVIAWGVLSVSGNFDRGLELAWSWLAPGGYLLLAEPVLESVLVYAVVRGDLDEFSRILAEGTRPGVWEERNENDDRYRVNPFSFYVDKLGALPGAEVVASNGINMLPSLVLGGLVQDSPTGETDLGRLSELLSDPDLDRLRLWRQAYWLLRKA